MKAEFEAQMSYLEPSIEAMLTAGEGGNDDDDVDDEDGDGDDDDRDDDEAEMSYLDDGAYGDAYDYTEDDADAADDDDDADGPVLTEGVSLPCYLAPRVPGLKGLSPQQYHTIQCH